MMHLADCLEIFFLDILLLGLNTFHFLLFQYGIHTIFRNLSKIVYYQDALSLFQCEQYGRSHIETILFYTLQQMWHHMKTIQ